MGVVAEGRHWDGSNLTVVGTLVSTDGVIGSFTIGATELDSGHVKLNGSGQISVGGAASDALWISTVGGAPHRIWIGDSTASVAIWHVDGNGAMYSKAGLQLGDGSATGGGLVFDENASAPASSPASGSQVRVYMKADKLIVQYNDGGTVRYYYLDLPSGSGTWAHTTSAP